MVYLGWFCLKPASPLPVLICAGRILLVFTFIYSFSVRRGERAWIVFVANVQPAKHQLLLRDSFHGTQKVKERRNIKE